MTGRRTHNPFIESFNGRLCDELLNETLFTSLARCLVASWTMTTTFAHSPPKKSPTKPSTIPQKALRTNSSFDERV
ncbi:MAG: transposase [Rhizobiales bacterium]|nr:transposase [Hyphomicrobiales bacterium]